MDELELRKQRRIVLYVQDRPRLAVTGIELLSPGNKQPGAVARERYLEKRASALHGGLHWVEIDLLRGGARPPLPVPCSESADYLSYVAQARPNGWNHLIYAWALADPLPLLPIPLLGIDQAQLDLNNCFTVAYERIAADDEVDYGGQPLAGPQQKGCGLGGPAVTSGGPSEEEAAWEMMKNLPSTWHSFLVLKWLLPRQQRWSPT